jgi:hypothetical protein
MALPKQRTFFTKVAVARQLLREKSEEILSEYMDVITKAKDARDFETAAKALQWLMEHMPADENNERIVDQSIDKKQEVVQKGPSGPAIQIGVIVGGLDKNQAAIQKPAEIIALPAEVISETRDE